MPPVVSNLALSAVCRTLNGRLAGARVKKVQELSGGGYKFRLVAQKRDADLILQSHYLFLASASVNAKKMTTGFGAFLNKQLEGHSISSISTLGAERIVRIAFDSFSLYLECFAEGNLILADANGQILGLEKRVEWKGRTLAKGETYKAPDSSARDPARLDDLELHLALMASAKRIVPALVQLVNTAGPIAEHATRKAGLVPDDLAKSTTPEQARLIVSELSRLYDPDSPNHFGLVRRSENELLVSQVLDVPDYAPLTEDADSFFSHARLQAQSPKTDVSLPIEGIAKEEPPLGNAIARQQKAREKLAADARQFRESARWIQTHCAQIESVLEAVRKGEKPDRLARPPIIRIDFDAKKHWLAIEAEEPH